MKITELKPIIKKYNKEELESIVVELYKRIPKYTKEDNNIDNFIINIQNDIKTIALNDKRWKADGISLRAIDALFKINYI